MPSKRPTKAQLETELAALRAQAATADRPGQFEDAEHTRALFDEAPVAYHELDAEGRIARVNHAELDLLGYTHDDMIGRCVWEFIGEGEVSREAVMGKLAGILPPSRRVERTYHRADGTPVPVLCDDRLIRSSSGQVTGILTALQDITDRKRAEQSSEQLAALVTQLEEQNVRNIHLNEMREFLLACSATSEIGTVSARSMVRLFPDSSGALLLLHASRNDLESVATWGRYPDDLDEHLFAPDACWGLRRGGPHVVDDARSGLLCPHVKSAPNGGYVCLPLTAKGDVLGLLHIRRESSGDAEDARTLSRINDLAHTVSGILSLSIWNMRLRETLAHQAVRDPLTGLFNRGFMEEALQREIFRASRRRTEIAVVMADVDHFKRFNDLHGHAAGDLVLAEMGTFLKSSVRRADLVCRYGGEEFAVILPDASAEEGVLRADVMRERVKAMRVAYGGQELDPVTLSLGVASFPSNGTTPADLLRAADAALYHAKQAGRDRVMAAESAPDAAARQPD
jgi:diguanylate cyclase (GGDEF)-like protein/PAS domain S-box-containing protein